jgi:hypothetical protein
MRFVINPRPHVSAEAILPDGWRIIPQPTAREGLWISILVGLVLLLIPFALLVVDSYLVPRAESNADATVSVWVLIPVVLGSIVVHEMLHLVGHPGGGSSGQSLVLVWPGKFQFGVLYEGWMGRARWLVMRLAPLAGLVALPTLILMIDPGTIPFFWRQFLALAMLVNAVGAGGDLAASVIVARQVPRGGEIGIWNGRACWRKKGLEALRK